MTRRGKSRACAVCDLQRKSETRALLNSGIVKVYIIGLIREFVNRKNDTDKYNWKNVCEGSELTDKSLS